MQPTARLALLAQQVKTHQRRDHEDGGDSSLALSAPVLTVST